MSEYKYAREGNEGNAENSGVGFSQRSRHGSHRASDVDGDSKSQCGYEECQRESSRSREKDREKGHDRERDRDRDRDLQRSRDMDRKRENEKERDQDRGHDRHHRDSHRDQGVRKERGRDRDNDDDYFRGQDYERKKDYDRDRENRNRRSQDRSEQRSRSSSKRKRVSGFDMAPPGMIASPAVTEGQFPGTNPAVPHMLQNLQQPGISVTPPVQAMTQQATRHARKVYVGGLSPNANEQSVATFFSQVMAKIGGNTAGSGDAVVNVYINHEKKFAFVEMRSVEEASNAMALNGIIFEGAPIKVNRPTDYKPSEAATLGPSQPNPNLNLAAVGLSPGLSGGLEGPDRIFVGGLPYHLTETQIRELLESFGPLKDFDLVKDRETGNSKGYAFCVYQDIAVTDIACAHLNGIKMGHKTLTVRRASEGASQSNSDQESVLMHAQQQIALQKVFFQAPVVPTKVLCLTQAVSPDELKDDNEYEDILDDMRQECGKFGTLVSVVIPRPNPMGEPSSGVGKVFLEYADVEGATKAHAGLNGRKFGGNEVIAVFYGENQFAQGDYEG